jgi:hypothetical protein
MFGWNPEVYEAPVGPWGQRTAGLLLLCAVALAVWYSASSVLGFWNAKGSGADPIAFSLVVLAATPWLCLVGVRLLAARMTRRNLMSPLGLITFGAFLVVGTLWWALAAMNDVSVGRGLLGGLSVGAAAIESGRRKRSKSALVRPDA